MGGGCVAVATDLGLQNLGADVGGFEVLRRASRKERVGDVFVRVGEGKEDECGVPPVFEFDVVKGATRANVLEVVELSLEGAVVDQFGLGEET